MSNGNRRLCPDEDCTGIIGTEGHCSVCGRAGGVGQETGQTSDKGTATHDAYPGCKMFVAPNGHAGAVVQKEGKLSGFIWDFFVSPRERARTAYDFVILAVSQGGNMLSTRGHPLLVSFFERFGFQAVAKSKGTPTLDVVHMMLLPKVFRTREPRFRQVLESSDPISDFLVSDGQHVSCAFCRRGVHAQVLEAESLRGYECPHCGFIRVHGTLTMGRSSKAGSPEDE